MVDALEISELLMAKICHDMAGPVGAINNGVELLKDPGQNLHDESIDLIEISAKEAVARILFFRQAYGSNRNPNGVSLSVIKEIVKNFFTNKHVTFTWPESHGDSDSMQPIRNDLAKLLLNMILIVAGSLIHGGNITIRIKNNKNDMGIKVRGEGKGVKLQDYIGKVLASDCKDSEIDSKNIQAWLTSMLAKKINSKISTDVSEHYIEMVAN